MNQNVDIGILAVQFSNCQDAGQSLGQQCKQLRGQVDITDARVMHVKNSWHAKHGSGDQVSLSSTWKSEWQQLEVLVCRM